MPSLPVKKDGECDSCSHQCETCKSAYIPLFKPPLKELPAGEGLTLFGWVTNTINYPALTADLYQNLQQQINPTTVVQAPPWN